MQAACLRDTQAHQRLPFYVLIKLLDVHLVMKWQSPWVCYSIRLGRCKLQLLSAALAYCPPKPWLLLVPRRLRLLVIFFFQELLMNSPFVAALILCLGG
jgi:hypothetical protein